MKKLIKNKRGVDAFTLILTVIAVSVLIIILIGLTMKYNNLKNTIGGAGSSASKILSTYDKADSALLFLDNAASISMQDAFYKTAFNGFYSQEKPSICGSHGDYAKWSNGCYEPIQCTAKVKTCIPKNYGAFYDYFGENLDSQIAEYNKSSDVNLTLDNYDLFLNAVNDPNHPVELLGLAEKPLIINESAVYYEVTPSFREAGEVNLIDDFKRIAENTNEVVDFIRELVKNVNNWPIPSEDEIKDFIDEYNKKNTGLEWSVDSYESHTGGLCETGDTCKTCCPCGDKCCPAIGIIYQTYLSYNMDLGIKIVDNDYKTKGEKTGYKAYVSDSGKPEVKDYDYRLSLNWISMTPMLSCVPPCSPPPSDKDACSNVKGDE